MTPVLTSSTTSTAQVERRKRSLSETNDFLLILGAAGLGLLPLASNVVFLDVDAHTWTADYNEPPPSSLVNRTDHPVGLHAPFVCSYGQHPGAETFSLLMRAGSGNLEHICVGLTDDLLSPVIDVLNPRETMGYMGPGAGKGSALTASALTMAAGASDENSSALSSESHVFSSTKRAFVEAREEVFADGMDSDFSRFIHSTIRTYGPVSISVIESAIQREQPGAEIVGETIRQIGSLRDSRSHQSRLAFLIRMLESPDPRFRDAASLGIAELDDPSAIGSISTAVERESSPLLKLDLELVLDQLQVSKSGILSQNA